MNPMPWLSVLLAIVLVPIAPAQDAPDAEEEPTSPKVLTVDDYGSWTRVSSATLSADGEWFSFVSSPNEGDATLHLGSTSSADLLTDAPADPNDDGEAVSDEESDEDASQEAEESDDEEATEAGPPWSFARGSSPRFSKDSRWFTCRVAPKSSKGDSGGSRGRGGESGGSGSSLRLIDLHESTVTEFDSVDSATFSDDSRWLALRKPRSSSSAEHRGRDLIIVDLTDGSARNFGNVGDFAFDDSGAWLAFTVDAANRHGNGVYLADLATHRVRPLETAAEHFSQLTWDEEGTSLAFLAGVKPEGHEHRANRLIAFRDVGGRSERRVELGNDDETLPEGMVVSDLRGLTFSEDLSQLYFGLKEQAPEAPKADGDRPDVDVWHWADERVQSIQERRASRDKSFTWSAVLHLESGRSLRLADESLRSVSIVGDGRWGIGRDDRNYRREITWGGSRADYYRVDLHTGERRLITESLGRPAGSSPDGRWYLYLKGGVLWADDLDSGDTFNLSQNTPVSFINTEDDHPYELPIYGVAGWTEDDRVVLRHRFDLWVLSLDGSSAENLTRGVGDGQQIRFRVVRLDREQEWLDLSAPMLLSAYGEWTKKSGFWQMEPGQDPQPLVFTDERFGSPIKAKDADRIVITRETFERCPDYWATDTHFASFDRLSDANPQQADFAWGRRILVDYENARGQRLQATLALPAGYVEGEQYPMLVYFYEKMSQRHHQYSFPRYDDRPHMSTYASDGYLVLMPDVVYEPGRPGDCALDCVTSAARKAIELGYADPDRVALQGHSWGGYQSSFILTQTDLFCAVVTGAPVTNLVSFHGELYKSSGNPQQGITEHGQVRMGTSPWENMELYHSQSPVHQVRKITTPFIILHGTDDGAVDWHQGLEFYNAARRHDKHGILLSYPGEGHHLARRPNQIDFQIRMKQFFDHYCKDTPAPEWLTDGVPFLQKNTATPRPKADRRKDLEPTDGQNGRD